MRSFLKWKILIVCCVISCNIQAQFVENKAITFSYGSIQYNDKTVQYVIGNLSSANAFTAKSQQFTLGTLQPINPQKVLAEDLNQIFKNAIIGPNPFYQNIHIQFNAPDLLLHSICLIDLNGHLIYKESLQQLAIGFQKEIAVNVNTGRLLILCIEFSVYTNPSQHYFKNYKLIRYE